MSKEDNKKRVGIFMDHDLYKDLVKDCSKLNSKLGIDLSVNKYILKILKERK